MSLLLIHPPVVKPCEPPAGIAKLSGALNQAGIGSDLWDANLECLWHFLQKPLSPTDTWTHRALRHRSLHLQLLKDGSSYRSFSRYKRAVNDLNRLLQMGLSSSRFRLSLGNYEDAQLSPTRSADLRRAAEIPEDNPFFPYFQEKFLTIVEHAQPSVVGFSLNFLSQALPTFSMIGHLKKHCPGVRVVLGGGLITSWMRRPNWSNPFQGLADFLVSGPGEEPLLAILGIRGIPLREVPVPEYDSLPTQGYLAPGFILPYSASSGCYWNRCSFCPEKAEGNPYLPIPDDRVIADLKSLVEKSKPVLIHLLDNALRPSLLGKIAENPPGAPWYGFARMTPHLADPDFCLALKRSGCTMLQLGLESGDQGVLEALGKGIDLGVASRALKNLAQAGISTYVYLLFGTPPETQKEARRTLEFVVHHHEQIRFLNLALFNLPVGVQGWEGPAREFCEGDLSLYRSFVHPRGWERNQVRQFLDKEFKRHPAIAAIVRRDPPVFTSNHAPFLAMTGNEGFMGQRVPGFKA